MIVCVCNRISDRDIHRLVAEGASTFEEVQMATGAATCCGCCETCARETFEDAQHQHHRVHANWIPIHPAPAVTVHAAVAHEGDPRHDLVMA